jgi:hypothetical protein
VKIADFGVSRHRSQEGDMTAETGTYRWMAPEVCCRFICCSFPLGNSDAHIPMTKSLNIMHKLCAITWCQMALLSLFISHPHQFMEQLVHQLLTKLRRLLVLSNCIVHPRCAD